MRRVTARPTPPTALTLQLVPPVLRALPWRPLAVSVVLGPLLAGLPRLTGTEPTPWLAVVLLRGAILVHALALALALDDPARHTTAAVPVSRALRTTVRLALVVPPTALWWTATLLAMPGGVRPPAGDLTVEAAAACLLALAAAVAAPRLTQDAEPGPRVATALLLTALLTALFVPDRWSLFPAPGDDHWAAAHDRWAALSALAAATLALTLRDPTARHLTHRKPG